MSIHPLVIRSVLCATLLSACASEAHSLGGSDTPAPARSSTVQVAVSNTSTPRAAPTATVPTELTQEPLESTVAPSPSPAPILQNPRITIGLSSEVDPLRTCLRSNELGQIIAVEDAYSTSLYSLGEIGAGYYVPTWAPDSSQFAYVVIKPEIFEEAIGEAFRRIDYPQSDSIWIVGRDGQGSRQIVADLGRREVFSAHLSGDGCDVTAGIVALNGWSADGTRLAFVYQVETDSVWQTELHVISLLTNDLQVIAVDVFPGSPTWRDTAGEIAAISGDGRTIGVVDADASPLASIRISASPDVPDDYQIRDIQWINGARKLLVLTIKALPSPEDASVLWLLDLDTNTWQRLAELPVGDTLTSMPRLYRNLICQSEGLGVIDIVGGMRTQIHSVDRIDCNTLHVLEPAPGLLDVLYSVSGDRNTIVAGHISGGSLTSIARVNVTSLIDVPGLAPFYFGWGQ